MGRERILGRVISRFGEWLGRGVAFELFVGRAVDADAGVPLGFIAAFGCDGASAVGDRIALEADRVAAAVANLFSLLLLKRMVTCPARHGVVLLL